MPTLQYSLEQFDQFVVNSYDGGMKSNPQKPNESFLIYNMIMREDGKLVPRGSIYEYMLPSSVRDATVYGLDTIVNNSGGMLYQNQSTPYFFFLENHPATGNLEFWVVNFNNVGQYIMNAVDHVNSTSTANPSVPSYCYAIDKDGNPFFLFCNWNCTGDDKLYTFNGQVVNTVSTSPPASQIMLGYYDRSTFAGGGSVNGSISMRSMVNWSTPLSITSWPATQFTAPFADRGMVLQDMVVANGRPIIMSNVSYLSVTGDATNYLPVEIARVEDVLLKSTAVAVGTEIFVAGTNGVYILTTNFKDLSLPVKGMYNPKTHPFGVSKAIAYTGMAAASSNGYFYAVQNNQLPAGWSLITPTANEKDNLLVYDTRFKVWYYWGVPFKMRGMTSIQPKPPVVTTQSLNFLSGFSFTGSSPMNNNAIYELEVTNTTGNDVVDGVPTNYTTGLFLLQLTLVYHMGLNMLVDSILLELPIAQLPFYWNLLMNQIIQRPRFSLELSLPCQSSFLGLPPYQLERLGLQ